MKRGEFWWVNCEPGVGGEVRKKPPAIIVLDQVERCLLIQLGLSLPEQV